MTIISEEARKYISAKRAYKYYYLFFQKSRRYFYYLINSGLVSGCFKIGKRIVIVREKFLEDLRTQEHEYVDCVKCWQEDCKVLGAKCTLNQLADFLDVSYDLLNRLIKKNREKFGLMGKKGNKRNYARKVDPLIVCEIMMDIDE